MTDTFQALIVTHGTHHGPRPDGDAITLDLTLALRNPADTRLRQLTGLDEEVRRYVLDTPGAEEIIRDNVDRVLLMYHGHDRRRGRPTLLHVCCRGGRHRGPAIGEAIAARLRAEGLCVRITHRDIGEPVVELEE